MLKNKKYQLAFILSGIGVFLILMVIMGILIIKKTLNPKDDTVESQATISFELKAPNTKPTTSDTKQSSDKELINKVQSYKDAENGKNNTSKTKNISFSNVFKEVKSTPNTNGNTTTLRSSENRNSQSNTSDELTQMLNDEIKSVQTQQRVVTKTSPAPKRQPPRDQQIEEDIRALYDKPLQPRAGAKTEKTQAEILAERKKAREQGFSMTQTNSTKSTGIQLNAYIHGEQEVASGGLVAIRLNEPISMNNVAIPRNTVCFGRLNIGNKRATITISSIQHNNDIYPITLSVYSSDGLEGIPVNISSTQKIVAEKTTDGLGRAADQVIRRTPLGSVVGGIASDMGRNSKREKTQTLSFINNQRLLLVQTN